MQLVCIICISACLVITSWSTVCSGAAARTTIPLASKVLKSEGVFLKDANIFEGSEFKGKTHSKNEQLKEELFSLSKDNTKVPLKSILNGEQQNHPSLSSGGKLLTSSSGQKVSIGVDNGASVESAASNDFAVDNGINVPSIVDINKSDLISANDSANINPEKKEEQSLSGLAGKYTSTSVQNATTSSLPKVMDPSFKTLAAISRRANRKHRNQNNHDRIKRSSLSRNNIGDEKYLRNVIAVEKGDFEYRRPWRISEPKIFSLLEETNHSKKKKKKKKKPKPPSENPKILWINYPPLLSTYSISKPSLLMKKTKKKELKNSGNNSTLKVTPSGTLNMTNMKEKELNFS